MLCFAPERVRWVAGEIWYPQQQGVWRADGRYELRLPYGDPRELILNDAFDIEIRRLAVGDYRLDDALLFERKTLGDLAMSIKDGRLFDQALRLANADLPAALILEGSGRDLASSGMRTESIQGALITVSLFIGLPLLRTRNAEQTAHTLLYAAR